MAKKNPSDSLNSSIPTPSGEELESMVAALHRWFRIEGRQLPIREGLPAGQRDGYKVWLAEVILQQTRMEQGMPYYARFLEAYPTVRNLAEASEDEVFRLWEGLGYYRRARMLHATAKRVVELHGGVFPADYEALKALPGLGGYTAAAVASLAYNLPHAAVDGNVSRVLSRLFLVEAPLYSTLSVKALNHYAEALMRTPEATNAPGLHNEAMIELGAMVCAPKPLCGICPLQPHCQAFAKGMQQRLPAKKPKKIVEELYIDLLILSTSKEVGEESILLSQPGANGIYAGLYTLPMAIHTKSVGPNTAPIFSEKDQLKEIIADLGIEQTNIPAFTHLLTHRKLHFRIFSAKWIGEVRDLADNQVVWPVERLNELPFPKPMREVLLRYFSEKG